MNDEWQYLRDTDNCSYGVYKKSRHFYERIRSDVDNYSIESDYSYLSEQQFAEEKQEDTERSSSDVELSSSTSSTYSDMNDYGLTIEEITDEEKHEYIESMRSTPESMMSTPESMISTPESTESTESSSDTDDESSNSDKIKANEHRLAFDGKREAYIQTEGQGRKRQRKDNTVVYCDICVIYSLYAEAINVAYYLCHLCEQYLCIKCFKGHGPHKFINLVGDEIYKDGQIDTFLDLMMNENDREKTFASEDLSVVDRVNVRVKLDQRDCWITGLCELNNARLAVCDNNNSCIKIFSSCSNILQNYFPLMFKPWDVIEIKLNLEPSEQGLLSTSKSSDISVTNRAKPHRHCQLVITLPLVKQIMFIDLTRNSLGKVKYIKTKQSCYFIDFSDNTLFTLCREDPGDRQWYVSLVSTEGIAIKNIYTGIYTNNMPYQAVCTGKIFIADWHSEKVFCMNNDGKVVAHKIIKGSRPEGISVDSYNNKVYTCARGHDKLYRLDSCLENLETQLDLKMANLEDTYALSFFGNTLFVGHHPGTSHKNVISMVRVL